MAGLAVGLSGLDGDDEYLFLTIPDEDEWIRTHLGGPCRAVSVDPESGSVRTRIRQIAKRMPGAVSMVRSLRGDANRRPPTSDGMIERLHVDVVHFTHQWGFLTSVPSIYHPHDLQHRHLPELFAPEERDRRDRWYSALSEQASVVAVASSWTRDDVAAEFQIPREKIHVVPWAPPLDAIAGKAPSTELPLSLPGRYVVYPAQTWAHKNHLGLVEALAQIRDQHDMHIPVVFTGRRTGFAAEIDRRIHELSLDDQVVWTGFLEPAHLRAVVGGATAVIVPSRFEAASAPLWEAFIAGVPAACSNVTSLPRQAGDAALVFDPHDTAAIASAVLKLWTDPGLRSRLIGRGRERVAPFTWSRTARHFRALYRRVAGAALTDSDAEILSREPLL